MTYSQTATHTYQAHRARTHRKRLWRRYLRRTVHFIGFLLYWAVVLSITYLVSLAAMIVCICLA